MKNHFRFPIAAAALCTALGYIATAQAQQPPYPGYGYGPGMWQQMTPEQQRQMWESMQRGGYGPGMMGGGYGPGYSMGPGMMGGYGAGYNMGPGMMGGYGPGMMGGWAGLKLTDAQMAQMEKIHDSLQEKHRKLMSEMWDEQAKMAKLYNAEKRDPAAIGKAHDRLSKLQREALEARIEAENKFDDVLTKEQKSQLRRGQGWGMMGY